MIENSYRGDELEYIATEAEGIQEYNSIRWFWNGHEINAHDIEMVIYNDEEQNK